MKLLLCLLFFNQVWVLLDKPIKVLLVLQDMNRLSIGSCQQLNELSLDIRKVACYHELLVPHGLEGILHVGDVEFPGCFPLVQDVLREIICNLVDDFGGLF
jgi:hypothetical protein